MGSNSDFQSELLRINGLLQASVTELRYRCEVYRLSLRSISKVLVNVHKEHGSHLRCLTTSRPSYQAYLLNLSQKQALDRIGNVVRKASTFINGYSLVEKELFLPPPPKPTAVPRPEKTASPPATVPVPPVPNLTDSSHCCSQMTAPATPKSGNCEVGTQIVSLIASDGAENTVKSGKAGGTQAPSKNKRKEEESQRQKSDQAKKRKQEESSKAQKHSRQIDHRSKSTTDSRDGNKHRSEKGKASKSSVTATKIKERSGPTCSTKQTTSKPTVIPSNRPNSKHSPGANGCLKKLGSLLVDCRKYNSRIGMSRTHNNNNLSGPKKSQVVANTEKLRTEARRAQQQQPRLGKQEEGRRGVANRVYNNNKDARPENKRSSGIRATHLKEIHNNNKGNKTRYKVGERLAVVRNHSSTATTTQGQGVARKCLCSSHNTKLQNNFKLMSSDAPEKVRRIQVNRNGEDNNKRSGRKVMSGQAICGGGSRSIPPLFDPLFLKKS